MWQSRLPKLVSDLEERQRRKITHDELARATDIRRPTITAWMNWATFKRLDADIVGRLADYFGCSPSELYEWVDDDQGQQTVVAAG